MAKFTPSVLTSTYGAVAALNANFDDIADLLEQCVFRDGTAPNTMNAVFDMNHFRIENLGAPANANDAVRLADISDLISSDAYQVLLSSGAGSAEIGYVAEGTGVATRTVQDKLREVRTLEDFGAVSYNNIPDALAGIDSTTAIQEAFDWASEGGTESRAIHVTGFFQCSNITLPPAIAVMGVSRQTSGFAVKTGTTGKWFSATDPQKLILSGMLFYANGLINISHIMDLGSSGQHGTEGYIEGCWFREAPEGYGLYINGNVSYVRNTTFESCKFPFKGIGNANKAENITIMQSGEGAETPSESIGLDIAGWQIDRVHIEAPISTSIPVSIKRADSSISKLSIAPAVASSFPVLIETDVITYDGGWAVDDVVVYSPENVTITESGLLRYGNPDTSSWTYTLGTDASALTGLSMKKGLRAHGGILEIKTSRKQAFMFRFENNGGVPRHRIGAHGDSSVAGSYCSKINSASNTFSNTVVASAGADNVTAMANGGKVSASAPSVFVFDTADQVTADQIITARVVANTTATALTAWPTLTSRDVNGVTRTRLEVQLLNATTGASFSFSSIGAGQLVDIQIEGFIA